MRGWLEMQLIVVKDYNALSKAATHILATEIMTNPQSCLGLATGSTPIGIYQELVSLFAEGVLDFAQVKTFNLDEYLGLMPSDVNSYRYFMQDNLFNHINIDAKNTHFPENMRANNDDCREYDKKIAQVGGIDLQLLGIGVNGHIGFNEPEDNFSSYTHKVNLTPSTIEANARLFENPEDMPWEAVTMGIGTIMRAKQIILVASGASKAKAVKDTIFGNITPQVPASVLQLHPKATIIVDEAAASLLDKDLLSNLKNK
jgi:glucosamine-6-phosphate deaminase